MTQSGEWMPNGRETIVISGAEMGIPADRPLPFAQILYIWQITEVQRKETLALLVDNIAAQRPSHTRPLVPLHHTTTCLLVQSSRWS